MSGFHLYRAAGGSDVEADARPTRLNAQLIPCKTPGNPTGASYAYLGGSAKAGVPYQYWLETVDVHGDAARYGPVSGSLSAATNLYLALVHR